MDTQLDYITSFSDFSKQLESWNPARSLHNSRAKVVDFFCGCGGTSLGFASVPGFFKILYGIDINKSALKSFETNFGCQTLCRDVRLLNDADLLEISNTINAAGAGPLVVVGCCPCQGFSAHRKKDGDKPEDLRNSLIGTFSTLALKLDPDYIVMENVQEVLNGKYRWHYEEAKKIFSEAGYFITQRIYNAASFGVPQARIRAIIVASKKPFDLPDEVLMPKEYHTVRDAIGNLPPANNPQGVDPYHFSSKHKQSTIDVIAQVPKDGGSRPQNVGPKCLDKVKGFYDVYGRLYWDKPSITITKTSRNPASGRFSHPEENRGLTLREAARLQSFPDAFRFEGGSSDRYEQVGEAVPPLLSLAIATKIYLEEMSHAI
ncbi:MAG: DNA cytosine methyltransferase [Paramuribaculum sp.]|nr:DNA cytosine methyltransferase [Paramuribaculum sp.]